MTDGERERLAQAIKKAMSRAREMAVQQTPPKASTDAPKPSPRDRPISFTPALLAAVIERRKVQTRRPVRPVPATVRDGVPYEEDGSAIDPICRVGDRLWVQEKWSREGEQFVYERDGADEVHWKSPRFMPKAAARLFLAVTGMQLARLRTIDAASAVAEGCGGNDPVASFLALWDSIYGSGEFAAPHDPWVWVISFERAQ